jgi:glycosyltransferase involved in cell wall biosynthesis
MKVCVATTVYPRWSGDGDGAFLGQFVQTLLHQGMEVRVVAMHSPGVAVYERLDGVDIYRPPYWWPVQAERLRRDGGGLPINFRRYWLARLQLPALLLVHAWAIAHMAHGCDLVHAHFTLSAAAAAVGQRIHRKPLVATVHGSDIYQVPNYPLGTAFTRRTLQACTQITTVSQALRQAAIQVGAPTERIRVISNSIDLVRFMPPALASKEPIILFVGSLIKRKGVATLIQALPQVLAVCPEYVLVIIGEGPEELVLKQLADHLGVAERVRFVGFLPQHDVQNWMQRARLFVLPSLEEGQGVVSLEALASGTPVVGSAVGGIAEVINQSVGALVPPAEPAALAKAILAILTDSEQWTVLSTNARRHVEAHYSGERIGQQYRELYATMGLPTTTSR